MMRMVTNVLSSVALIAGAHATEETAPAAQPKC